MSNEHQIEKLISELEALKSEKMALEQEMVQLRLAVDRMKPPGTNMVATRRLI